MKFNSFDLVAAVADMDEAIYNDLIKINGLFDDSYTRIGSIGSSELVFTAVTSDIPNRAEGDTLKINGTVYTVVEVHDDSNGLTDLVLRT